MRALIRWVVGTVFIVHGFIHLVGAIKGFGWADVSQLTEPIGTMMGACWLAAGAMSVVAGVLLIARASTWWILAAVAALSSQALILSAWNDAKAGTVANVLLAIAAAYGLRSQGPRSFRSRFRQVARETSASVKPTVVGPVTDRELGHLPSPVANYLRRAGTLGRPHIFGFHADISGRIRGGSDQPWMSWRGEQVNTYGATPSRVFYMDATMKGLPTDVLHAYVGPSARMQVRLASLATIVDAHGPEMDQAETVTLLNDLCILAPAALVDAPIEWSSLDSHHVRATYRNAGHTVSAVLTFDEQDQLVDFVSDDRLRSSSDGRTFTRQRWSTPLADYRSFGDRRLASRGRAFWQPTDGPSFDYLEFHVDNITYQEAKP
ncbi:MAG: DUF6544 family protein [Myxococcaceae bacterium]